MRRDMALLERMQKDLDELRGLCSRGGDGMTKLKITVVDSIEGQTKILARLCEEFPVVEEEPIKA